LAGTEPSNSFRSELKTGVEASAGLRVDVRAWDELEVLARAAGTGDVVPVLAATESGGMFRGGVTAALCPAAGAGIRVEVDAGAGTGGVVTVFAGTESGDGV
jgi:hypothetical protein